MLVDLVFVAARIAAIRAAHRAAAAGLPYPMDHYLVISIGWCLLQGCIAMAALNTNSHALDIIAIISALAMTGPICARNYAAPRYAFLLICLVDVPTVAGAQLSGEPLMWLMLLQAPLFLLSCLAILKRFQRLAIDALMAQRVSQLSAREDSLTSLLNRSGLSEALARLDHPPLAPIALFYLDLDGFKEVNDRLGHAAGDELLCQVAARLRLQIRANDVLARLGGDEFVIAARDLSPATAASFADSLISRIATDPFDLESASGVTIGVSIGFVCRPHDGTTIEELHKKADAALYASKRAGRGVSTHFGATRLHGIKAA
jgi:diguanylate cyclase (GGDEF)-like protein